MPRDEMVKDAINTIEALEQRIVELQDKLSEVYTTREQARMETEKLKGVVAKLHNFGKDKEGYAAVREALKTKGITLED
jgi:hypothetical protein